MEGAVKHDFYLWFPPSTRMYSFEPDLELTIGNLIDQAKRSGHIPLDFAEPWRLLCGGTVLAESPSDKLFVRAPEGSVPFFDTSKENPLYFEIVPVAKPPGQKQKREDFLEEDEAEGVGDSGTPPPTQPSKRQKKDTEGLSLVKPEADSGHTPFFSPSADRRIDPMMVEKQVTDLLRILNSGHRDISRFTAASIASDHPFQNDFVKDFGTGAAQFKQVYIRKAFRDMIEIIRQDFAQAGSKNTVDLIFTGSPGIGKSLFLGMVAGFLPTVGIEGLQIRLGAVELLFQLKETKWKRVESLNCPVQKICRVSDPLSNEQVQHNPYYHNLVFTSPTEEHIKNLRKNMTFKTYVLPVYTYEELREMNNTIYIDEPISEEDLQNRFDRVGGAPRYVFSPRYEDSEKTFITNLKAMDTANFESVIRDNIRFSKERIDVPNRLLHLFNRQYEMAMEDETMKVDYTIFTRNFCSHFFFKLWINLLEERKLDFELKFCANKQLEGAQRLRGTFIEDALLDNEYFMKVKNSPFFILNDRGSELVKDQEMIFHVNAQKTFEYAEFDESMAAMRNALREKKESDYYLYRPKSKIHETFDFYCVVEINKKLHPAGVQVTVNVDHGLKRPGLLRFYNHFKARSGYKLSDKLGKPVILMIYPDDVSQQVKKQKVTGTKNPEEGRDPGLVQYLIEIDTIKMRDVLLPGGPIGAGKSSSSSGK